MKFFNLNFISIKPLIYDYAMVNKEIIDWAFVKKIPFLKLLKFENERESLLMRKTAIQEMENSLFNVNPRVEEYFYMRNYENEIKKDFTSK